MSGLKNTAACEEDQQNQFPTDFVNSAIDPIGSLLVTPNGTQWTRIVLERTQEAGIRSKTS